MKLRSTRGDVLVGIDEALLSGIAADGGLFMPESVPGFEVDDFRAASSLIDIARVLLTPFFSESALAESLDDILSETLSFPIPISKLEVDDGRAWMLELYHGPTAAFKDVGAGFLAACLSRLQGDADAPLIILVATSGDTGGAVAAAFDRRPGVRVVVLFPHGRVSERQARQLTCWSDNVLSLEVLGTFDDCQAMVKAAFADPDLSGRYRFSSANSINIGRLLPQCTYYAYASLRHFRETSRQPGFIVPTGNLGNGLACILARDMGLPIGEIVLASNANRLIADYLAGAEWLPRASIRTLATAMDVGNPSNMERLLALHGESAELRGMISAVSITDAQIERQIKEDHARFGFATCPHTATATCAFHHLTAEQREKDWIIVATAHPAKFESVVEPLIGETVPIPDALADILSRPSRSLSIEPTLGALAEALAVSIPVDESVTSGDK